MATTGGLGVSMTLDVTKASKKLLRVGKELNVNAVLKFIGQQELFWINENFRKQGIEVPWQPLSRNTLANPKRGSGAQILRNTGRLAASFDSHGVKVQGEDTVRVGTEVPYAKYHHFGGRGSYEIRPRRAKALAFWTISGLTFRKSVIHPPLPSRPLLPSETLANKIARDALKVYVEEALKRAKD